MATETLKIDASWAEEFTKTSEQILMTPSVGYVVSVVLWREYIENLGVTPSNRQFW